MSATINDIIRHLLMEEDQVCLPGVGTLRLQPQPALLSALNHEASPPSELVSFNANLLLDDGKIVRELENTGLYSREDAVLLLEEYLRNLQENLDAGRSVTLEEIGRLFKHHDGQVRFTPAGGNFSKDSFGLPAVELRPIVRTEKQRRAGADPMLANPMATAGEAAQPVPKNAWEEVLYHPQLRTILWYVAGVLAIILVLAAIYRLAQFGGSKLVDDPQAPIATERPDQRPATVPEDRINVAPGPQIVVPSDEVVPDEPPRLSDPDIRESVSPSSEAPAGNTPPQTTTPATTTPPQQERTTPPASSTNRALIATGLFGSQRNVTKNIDRIKAAGFTSFSRPEGRLTRIGARIEYRTEEELRIALERIQRLYSDAYVMEINGQEQRID